MQVRYQFFTLIRYLFSTNNVDLYSDTHSSAYNNIKFKNDVCGDMMCKRMWDLGVILSYHMKSSGYLLGNIAVVSTGNI